MHVSSTLKMLSISAIVAGPLATVLTRMPAAQQGGALSVVPGEWPHYAADLRGTHYWPLAEIDRTNFKTLSTASSTRPPERGARSLRSTRRPAS